MVRGTVLEATLKARFGTVLSPRYPDRMKLDIDPEDLKRILAAIDHYVAYLKSQRRSDSEFERLAERLRK